MDTFPEICYVVGHETTRKRPRTRKTKTSCHRPVAGWQITSSRRRHDRIFPKFHCPLVSGVAATGGQGTSDEADPRTTPWALGGTKAKAQTTFAQGSPGSRVFHQPVDIEAHGGAHRDTLRDTLSSRSCVENSPEGPGLELAEAGEKSDPAGREGDRSLEARHLAPYKKKRNGLRPTWSFSMRADFSSSPTWPKPGRRSDRRRFSGTATSGTRFRPFQGSRFRRPADGWGSTSTFIRPISPGWRSSDSFGIFSVICAGPWFFCGTGAPSTGADWSRISYENKRDCGFTVSPRIPPRSIRMNSFGRRPSMICPTELHGISGTSTNSCVDRSDASGIHRGCCGRAFMHRNCRGDGRCTHSLCDGQ